MSLARRSFLQIISGALASLTAAAAPSMVAPEITDYTVLFRNTIFRNINRKVIVIPAGKWRFVNCKFYDVIFELEHGANFQTENCWSFNGHFGVTPDGQTIVRDRSLEVPIA